MSDYPKYRLKKDTPNYEAGSIFIVRTDGILLSGKDEIEDLSGNFYDKVANIKHFDEWFEEVKEPTWVRKQIKQIEFSEHKLVCVVVRFIKEQRYIYNDKEFGDCVSCNEVGEIKKIYFGANESKFWQQENHDILNRMIRDGYIEIKDNPNIVWEDEND